MLLQQTQQTLVALVALSEEMVKEKVMIAVRSVQDVIAGAVTIKLPAHFTGKRVEVIVLPIEENDRGPEHLQRLLLDAPTLSEEDLQGFAQVMDWMNQWTVSEF